MFDGEKKRPVRPEPLKRGGTPNLISGRIVASCYVTSAGIVVIAGVEAARSFGAGNDSAGSLYVTIAGLGVLFSIFITWMNHRNRRLLGQNGQTKKQKRADRPRP
ncbi:MAG: hypothetical protein AB7E30_09310 [Lawsonibacter sp.]